MTHLFYIGFHHNQTTINSINKKRNIPPIWFTFSQNEQIYSIFGAVFSLKMSQNLLLFDYLTYTSLTRTQTPYTQTFQLNIFMRLLQILKKITQRGNKF